MDNNNQEPVFNSMFSFGENSSKKKKGHLEKHEKRRKNFLNEFDSDDLKRKREDKNISLRQDKKKAMLNKRRMLGNQTNNINEETKVQEKTYTISEAEGLYQDGMDIMEFFAILNKTEFHVQHFIDLIKLIYEKDDHKILFGIVGLRKLLSLIDKPPIQNVVDANLIPVLLTLASTSKVPRLRFEALWCLTNIASGSTDHVQALIDKGALQVFVTMLMSDQKNIVEQTIWALGNIAGEDVYFRSLILKEGGLQPILVILSKVEPDTMICRNGAW